MYTDNGICMCAQNIYCQSFGKEEGEKNRVIIDLGTKEGRRRRRLGVLLLIKKSLKGKAKGGWEENFREF